MINKQYEVMKMANQILLLSVKVIPLLAIAITTMAFMWNGLIIISVWLDITKGTAWLAIFVIAIIAAIAVTTDRKITGRTKKAEKTGDE